MLYEIAQVQVAEQGLPTKAIGRWFPYVASLMIFIWTVNMLGFIPLPLSDERYEIAGVEVPTLAIFAATSTLSVTLALGAQILMAHWMGARRFEDVNRLFWRAIRLATAVAGIYAIMLWVLADRVLLYTDDADETQHGLHVRGITPEQVLVRRSTLEDVFLRLTGRSLIE